MVSIGTGDDFLFPCRQFFARSTHPSVEVVGSALESEAIEAHRILAGLK